MLKMRKVDKVKAKKDGFVKFEGFDISKVEDYFEFDWTHIILEGLYGKSETYYWTNNGELVFIMNIFDYKTNSKGKFNYIYINYVETISKFRRKGYGKECMRQFEELCLKERGVSCFVLCTIDTKESNEFFKSIGYIHRPTSRNPTERIKETT